MIALTCQAHHHGSGQHLGRFFFQRGRCCHPFRIPNALGSARKKQKHTSRHSMTTGIYAAPIDPRLQPLQLDRSIWHTHQEPDDRLVGDRQQVVFTWAPGVFSRKHLAKSGPGLTPGSWRPASPQRRARWPRSGRPLPRHDVVVAESWKHAGHGAQTFHSKS